VRDVRVEMIGHASMWIYGGGGRLLTDPWLVDPIGCGSGFHFPPLVHEPAQVAAQTDWIYVSHVHPDHFNAQTLALFPQHVPIFIGEYRRKEFRDEVRATGHPVVEVPFETPFRIEGSDVEIVIIEHDYEESAAFDSALIVRTPAFTVFENNDCFLRAEKYHWVRERYAIDYAFLGYSPASFFPICFDMDPEEKAHHLREAAERRYKDFLDAVRILAPRLAVPFASGARFLETDALWKNVSFNSDTEAIERLAASGLGVAGTTMGPGDRLLDDDTVERRAPVLDKAAELAAITEHARRVQDWVRGCALAEPPARADLVEQFRDYILGLRRATRDALPGVREHVIAYVLVGPEPKRFYFDFSRPDDEVFQWGDPPRYDMRYTYAASALQLRLDGVIDWDELHFTNEVRVHQVRYAKDFYMMLRSEMLDLERP